MDPPVTRLEPAVIGRGGARLLNRCRMPSSQSHNKSGRVLLLCLASAIGARVPLPPALFEDLMNGAARIESANHAKFAGGAAVLRRCVARSPTTERGPAPRPFTLRPRD